MSFLKAMFNSVARTFGRILAYALIGIAIYFIASKVHASPQYRYSTGSWTSWADLTLENNYQFATSTTTSWTSYIQLKDTVAFDANKTYNLYATFEVKLTQSGTREIFSAIDPYIYDGSTLTSVGDKCTITGTRSDKTTTSPITTTTHTYKGSINCVGLKNQGYYPYLTLRFYSTTALATAFQFKIDKWEYHVGSDSTDANNIMNNANQNTQQIVENNNQNTQDIINNQNENTTQVIEALDNQNKVCHSYDLYYDKNTNSDLGVLSASNGELVSSLEYYTTSDYIGINKNNDYYIRFSSSQYNVICKYNSDKEFETCTTSNGSEVTKNYNTDGFIRISFYNNRNVTVSGSYCYDYREKETEQNEEIVDNLHNMLTLLQSDDAPSGSNISSAFGGVNLTDETPFTNLLMFPVLIFSYFSNSMSNSCSPVVLGSLYGHELSLPCLNLPNYLGLTLWNIIDLLFVFYMIYNIAHLFIGILEDITELRSPFLRFFIKNKGVVNHD